MTGRMGLMLAILLLLAALVGLDRLRGGDPAAEPSSTGSVAAPSPPAAGPTPGDAVAATALFERPLFAPSRRPAQLPSDPKDGEDGEDVPMRPSAPVVAAPEAPPVVPLLFGTVTSPPPGGVFVGDSSGGTIDYIEPGGSSHGLTLVSIGDSSALFTGADGREVTLHLGPTPGDEPQH